MYYKNTLIEMKPFDSRLVGPTQRHAALRSDCQIALSISKLTNQAIISSSTPLPSTFPLVKKPPKLGIYSEWGAVSY
jgi:hypothetical protein